MKRLRTLILMLATGLVLAACGGGDTSDTETTAGNEGAAETTAASDEATTTAADEMTTTTAGDSASTSGEEMMEGVHAADTDLGTILVDPEGFTLYMFTADTDGESTCYDACADLWPPLPAETEISSDLDQAMFGSTTRTDGSEQLTVNGMPLYLYTPDTAPGDTTGQNFNGLWFVLDTDGNIVETTATEDTGYSYEY